MDEPLFDPKNLPRHIAIIMDGNGRWARQRGLPRTEGHRAGVESMREAVRCCNDWGVPFLTLYAFSVDNWKRPEPEVQFLMGLLGSYLTQEIEAMHRQNVRFRSIGDASGFSQSIARRLADGTRLTQANTGLTLTLALNYGSRAEIVQAVRSLASDVREGKLEPAQITEEALSSRLFNPDVPDPDFLVRTSGEMRVSNFLLWQLSYSEFYFTDVLWPDFRREHLARAIHEYQQRNRRFGGA